MKRLIVKGVIIAVMAIALALPLASPVFAATQPTQTTQTTTTGQSGSSATPLTKPTQTPTTGQPGTSAGVNCEVSTGPTSTPGKSSSSPGAPFNEPMINSTNGGKAGSVYAGSGVSATTANSSAAVSQYDVACSK